MTERNLITAIDAGHGGAHHGARCYRGILREADLTLAVALAAKKMRPNLHLIRDCDTTMRLRHRHTRAVAVKADLVISVHFNSVCPDISYEWGFNHAIRHDKTEVEARAEGERARAGAPLRHGLNAHYWAGNSGTITRDLARCAVNSVPTELRGGHILDHREGTPGVRAVLGAYWAPALLLECGYLSSARDVGYIHTTEGIEAIAGVLLDVDDRFREIMGEINGT